jgi:protein O-GlcNAc transferase
VFTREELGLPSTGFVYACFNRLDKVEPSMFGAWMTILSRVPNSVLWLAASHPTSVINLKHVASTQYGINSERLIFASKTPLKSDHYARHRMADLFLDTRYYNAHTTATDALWAGLPVLTYPGTTLASRVAASLVTAAGLAPHLIASSLDDYIHKAVALASSNGINSNGNGVTLEQLRHLLVDERASHPLFNTPLYARGLEDLYESVWNEWAQLDTTTTPASSPSNPSSEKRRREGRHHKLKSEL